MNVPEDFTAEALAASGGDTVPATDSTLSQTPDSPDSTPPPSNPSPDSPPTPAQPEIDRFSQSQSQSPPPQSPSPSPPPPTTPLSNHRREEIDFTPRKLQKCETAIPTSPAPPLEPLSERMRPRNVDEVVGQDHLLWKSSLLRSGIDCDILPSVVLWGPPGTGKTSIARAIVYSNSNSSSSYRFVALSAVNCGVKEVREAVDEARKWRLQSNSKKRTVLFIDEVHRFNKSQQDSFLPVIEDGSIVFVGATTENPSFHLITALLSRCRVLKLNSLSPQHVSELLRRAVNDLDKGLIQSLPQFPARVEVDDDAIEFICANCDGDARVALNALEVSATTAAARSNSTSWNGDARVAHNALEVFSTTATAWSLATDCDGDALYALEEYAATATNCDGDARVALNAVEVSASTDATWSNSTATTTNCDGDARVALSALEVSATTAATSCDGDAMVTLNAPEVSATTAAARSNSTATYCIGDSRVALNALEVASTTAAAQSNSTATNCDGDARVALTPLEVSATTASATTTNCDGNSRFALIPLEVSASTQSNSTDTSTNCNGDAKVALSSLEVSSTTATNCNGDARVALSALEVFATTNSTATTTNCDGDTRVALIPLEVSATTAPTQSSSIATTTIYDGDATVALNALEVSATTAARGCVVRVTLEDAKEAFQWNHQGSDKAGEEHSNLTSALQKSMRGSDANASIYWLSRLLQGGEEPLSIARTLIRFASEDVGLADPAALPKAVACCQACHFLGLPECNVSLAECVAYLALAPKSVAVYEALEAAQRVVRDSVGQNEGVPLHLRNAPTKLMKEIGYGKGYVYTPDDPLAAQSYLPASLQGYKFLDFHGGLNS